MGRGLTTRALCVTAATMAVAGACTESSPRYGGDTTDASATIASYRDAPPLPDAAASVCGDERCASPSSGPLGAVACCGDAGDCGAASSFAPDLCVSVPLAGAPDLDCPPFAALESAILQGCCGPGDRCGVFDRFGKMGCIPGPRLGRDPVHCEFDAAATCTSVVEVACDGAEDCPDGSVCCGRAQPDRYDAFGCFPDCSTIADPERGTWRQICHLGQPCAHPGEWCEKSPSLPAKMSRCSATPPPDGGVESVDVGVRCGDGTCNPGEKCCLRPPRAPYCAPGQARCRCSETPLSGDAADVRVDAKQDRDASLDDAR